MKLAATLLFLEIIAAGAWGQTAGPVSAPLQTTGAPMAAYTVPADNSMPAPATPATSGAYVLQPHDSISIAVYGEANLCLPCQLNEDGAITYPFLGQVKLGGLSVLAAQDLIAKKLDADVLVNPQVTLNVVGYTEQYFTILGQVGSPKVYPLPHDHALTLLEAVGTAGGYTIYANDRSVKITRTYGGKRTTFKVNARDIANSKANDPCIIRPGDVINVPMSPF